MFLYLYSEGSLQWALSRLYTNQQGFLKTVQTNLLRLSTSTPLILLSFPWGLFMGCSEHLAKFVESLSPPHLVLPHDLLQGEDLATIRRRPCKKVDLHTGNLMTIDWWWNYIEFRERTKWLQNDTNDEPPQ